MNSNRKSGFTAKDMDKCKRYSQKASQGLAAINSANLEESEEIRNDRVLVAERLKKIGKLNDVMKELHSELDQEKTEMLQRRKEESRHEMTFAEQFTKNQRGDNRFLSPKSRMLERRPSFNSQSSVVGIESRRGSDFIGLGRSLSFTLESAKMLNASSTSQPGSSLERNLSFNAQSAKPGRLVRGSGKFSGRASFNSKSAVLGSP